MALSSLFLFTIMVACAVCGALPFQKTQVEDGGSVVLYLPRTGSTLDASCRDGSVTLRVTNSAHHGHTARIRIGPEVLPEEGNACWSGNREYQVSPVLILNATDACGRWDGHDYFELFAVVEERINPPSTPVLQVFTATIVVRCVQTTAVAPATGLTIPPPYPYPEGIAELTETPVAFELAEDQHHDQYFGSTPVWALTLRPVDPAALAGRDYVLTKLTATPMGEAGGPTFDFIVDGHIVDGFGTTVTRTDSQTYTIMIKVFQFANRPGIGVDFTADVLLCGVEDCSYIYFRSSRTAITQRDSGKKQNRLSHSDIRIRQIGSNTETIL